MSLAQEIMNLSMPKPHGVNQGETLAYKFGHRDARHAAAELVTRFVEAVHEMRIEQINLGRLRREVKKCGKLTRDLEDKLKTRRDRLGRLKREVDMTLGIIDSMV